MVLVSDGMIRWEFVKVSFIERVFAHNLVIKLDFFNDYVDDDGGFLSQFFHYFLVGDIVLILFRL